MISPETKLISYRYINNHITKPFKIEIWYDRPGVNYVQFVRNHTVYKIMNFANADESADYFLNY